MTRLRTADEVAERLGVTKDWVWAPARTGRIPHIQLGRYRRFREDTLDGIKGERNAHRTLARRARQNVYKLMLAIEDGTRLEPIAAKLYVVTDGAPPEDARAWFDLWWNEARAVAEHHGLQLLPTGWLDATAVDPRLLDDLVEMRSPL